MKELNNALKNRQELYRQETCKKVEKAINELMEEGFEVSTKLLIERTGLSRPVFGKKHVLEVLKKYEVCRYKNIKKVSVKSDKNYVSDLEKLIRDLTRQVNKLKGDVDKYHGKIVRLELTIQDLTETNQLLRGELHSYYEKALAHGINLDS